MEQILQPNQNNENKRNNLNKNNKNLNNNIIKKTTKETAYKRVTTNNTNNNNNNSNIKNEGNNIEEKHKEKIYNFNENNNNSNQSLIIDTSCEGITKIAKVEILNNNQNKLITLIEEFDTEENIQSNIYLGKVIKIDRSNNSIFLTYETGKTCFLNIKEFTKQNKSQEYIDNIKIGDTVIVQMVRERKNHKNPKVTTNIMMYGLYANILVDQEFSLFYNTHDLINTPIYNSLKQHKILNNCKIFLKQSPVLINQKILLEDLKYMIRLWKHIKKIAETKKEIGLLHFEPHIQRMIRAIINEKVNSIVVSNEQIFQRIKSMPFLLNSKQSKNIILYDNAQKKNILQEYGIEQDVLNIDKLVINREGVRINFHKTDALITIDVDYSSRNNSKKTLLDVNKLAADMIITEIIKKNIGGSVLIDFINMSTSLEMHNELLNYVKKNLENKEIKCTVYNIKQLGFIFFCLPYNKYDIFNRIYDTCSHCHFGVVHKKIYNTYHNIHLLQSFLKNPQIFNDENISYDGVKIIIKKDIYNILYKQSPQLMIDVVNTGVVINIE